MNFSSVMYDLIASLSLFNFGRILAMLIGSDLYDIREMAKRQRDKKLTPYKPLVSVLIPAYNEEVGVIRTLDSIRANSYANYEIIVVNDGSTDKTSRVVRSYIKRVPNPETRSYMARDGQSSKLRRRYSQSRETRIVLVNQHNGGKGAALNNGIKNYSKGKLVMVVDADSLLHPNAIEKMVQHFRDRKVIAAASNVKVIPSKSVLGIAQRIEYLISYRMKRSLTYFGMEYIIGGVGSTFRRSILLEAGIYDTDTMTEDIDLTLKLIKRYGNKKGSIHYAADVLTYTEHVLSFRSLIKQRFRWKFGRFQSLLKNRSLFFSRESEYSKQLTWYQLPYAIFGEFILLLEPFLVAYILYVTVRFLDLTSILSVYCIVSAFVFLMLLGEDSESWRSKGFMSIVLPLVYFLMYILTAVEFVALLRSMRQSKKLFDNKVYEGSWEHVERSGKPIAIAS
jgi:poly-beta-1,6-N-acetyl-D-glucosamine synthase